MNRIILLFLVIVSCTRTKTPLEEAYELFDQHRYYTALERLAAVGDDDYCEREELKGHCYWAIKLYDGAAEIFENLLDTCSGNIDIYINLGDAYYKEEKDSLAHYYFKKAHELDSTNHIVNFNLGLMNYNASYGYATKKYLTKAIKYSPKAEPDYYNLLIETLCLLEEYDSAFEMNRQFVDQTSGQDKLFAYLNEANIYGNMGQHKKCIDMINKILSTEILNTDNQFSAYYNRYISWVLLNDSTNACNDYRKLLKMGGKNIENYFECEESN